MRLIPSLIATLAVLFVTTTAGAVEFSIVGADSATVLPGEQVTIDIVITNNSLTSVNGLGASVTDYGANEFVSGQAVTNYLNAICVAPGSCFGGLDNLAGPALSQSSIGANGNRIQIALSAALTGVVGAPNTDQGLDGVTGTAQFTVTFTARESAAINISTGYQGDGVILGDGSTIQAEGATFNLTVVPEPGTALLMGLGLAGLASAGRRK